MDTDLEQVRGDGSSRPLTPDEVQGLKAELSLIRQEISEAVATQRETNAQTRYCVWTGQSPDGRKRKNSLGQDAFPFEGASDGRIRLADKIINEHVEEYLTAALRGIPRVVGTEGQDEGFAARISNLLRYLIRNVWGPRYLEEMELLTQWMEGDTPAAAVLGVFWCQETAVEMVELGMQDVLDELLSRAAANEQQPTEEDLQQIVEAMYDPSMRDQLVALLEPMFPEALRRTVRHAAEELQTTGRTTVPRQYVRRNVPELRALRLFEDVFFRANTTDLQKAPQVFVRTWLTAAEVLEWAKRDGWDQRFVVELMGEDGGGKAGQSCLDEMQQTTSPTEVHDPDLATLRRGLFEVLWVYQRAATDTGAIGVFCTVMSGLCETPATKQRLIEERTGEYPMVVFRRERLTRRIAESRSVAEIVVTDQQSLKLLRDSLEDHVQVTTNPPVRVPSGAAKYQVVLAPFGQVESNPRAPVEFMERPAYPAATVKFREDLRAEIDDYWGRENAVVPESRRMLKSQHRVNLFLAGMGEALAKVVQLCQQFMTDEDMMRIARGAFAGKSTKEIQGRFDLQVSFDVRDMDSEFLMKKGELIMKYARPLDTRGTVPWEMLVRNIVEAIDPSWADLLPAPDEAMLKIRKDEQDVYLRLLNGVEPDMPERIEAPQMRLQVLQESHGPRTQNPGAFAPLAPAAQAMLENRAKYLQQQVAQQDNAVIGRVGAKPVEVGTL